MSFSHQIVYAADDGLPGGIPAGPGNTGGQQGPRGVNPSGKKLENVLSELSESNRRLHSMLMKALGVSGAPQPAAGTENQEGQTKNLSDAITEGMLGPLKEVFSLEDLLGPIFGEEGLGGLFDRKDEKPKERPRLSDMMRLPGEHSLGYTFLYWKLDEIAGLLRGDGQDEREERGRGIGGFFQGLLRGAGAIALLAGAMVLFAGALLIFAQLEGSDWARALAGIGAFAVFVAGAVIVARYVSQFQAQFADFARGVLYLTAGMILFGAAVFVMAYIRPYIPDALRGIALFGLFVGGAAVAARIVGDNLGSFAQFGFGMILLTVGLGLFAGAIWLMNWAEPFIPGAIRGIGLFGIFSGLAVAAAYFLGSQIPALGTMAVGIMLLTAGLGLFAGTLWVIDNILTIGALTTGIAVMGLMGLFVTAAGALGYLLIPLMPGIAVIAVGAVALSLGMVAFGGAIRSVQDIGEGEIDTATDALRGMIGVARVAGRLGIRLALALPGLAIVGTAGLMLAAGMTAFGMAIRATARVADDVPVAIPALQDMMRFLTNPNALTGSGDSLALVEGENAGVMEMMQFMGLRVIGRLAAFGLALTPFANGMTRFANTIQAVAEVGDVVPPAIESLHRMMLFLSNPNGAIGEDGRPVDGSALPGVLQLIDTVRGVVMVRLGLFGLALQPFSEGMLRFAEVIEQVARMGEPARIARAVEGLGNMVGFLIGGGPANVPTDESVVGMMEHMNVRVAVRLAAFGAAIGPLSSALLDFAQVVNFVAEMDDKVDRAIPGLRQMFDFLAGPQDWSVASLVGTVDRRLSRNVGRFGAALEPFSSGMLTFTGVVDRVGALVGTGDSSSPLNRAIEGIRQMVTFLVEAGEAVEGVSSGGFLGLGRSNLERFGSALDPFAEGIGRFISLTQNMAGNEENVQSSHDMLNTMIQMLTSAGAVVGGPADPSNVRAFQTSLHLLGDGITRFDGQMRRTEVFVLDRVAAALERIAAVDFGTMFTPFIEFMNYNDQLRETATHLQTINEALTPREPTTLDRISGAIGGLFNRNRGGDRAEIDDTAVAAYVGAPATDGSTEGYVAGIFEIMSRWDRNPIQLPQGGDTNMMVVQNARNGERQNAFGGAF